MHCVGVAHHRGAGVAQVVERDVARSRLRASAPARRPCTGRCRGPCAGSSIHSATEAMSPPPCSGTTRTTPWRPRSASSFVGAQCTIVNVAAVSLTNLPAGCVALGEALAVHARCCSPSSSGGTPTVNEHSPMPLLPDLLWPGEAARRAEDRRVRLLQRLREHAPRRAHLPVLAVGLVLVLGPRAHDVTERLAPHLARLVRARRRSPRARHASTSGRCRSRRGRRR